MVILGISHDSGYAPFIDELHSSNNARGRMCILEGFPIVRELMGFNLAIVNFNDTVFRSDKIVVDRTNNGFFNNSNGTKAASSNSIAAQPPLLAPAAETNSYVSNSPPGPKPSELAKDNPGKATTPVSSYATATVSSRPEGPPALTFPAATAKTMQSKAAAIATATAKLMEKNKTNWSPGPRGLDQPVTFNPTFVDAVKRRKGPEKFCNTYVLCGYCTKDYCEYNHKLKATPEEKKALAFLMRQSPCTFGQECSNDDCIYGHNVSPHVSFLLSFFPFFPFFPLHLSLSGLLANPPSALVSATANACSRTAASPRSCTLPKPSLSSRSLAMINR